MTASPQWHSKESAVNVTGVNVEVLRVPVQNPYTAAGRQVEGNWHVLARLTTDDGLEGIGYIVSNRGDLVRVVAQATRELGEHLIGMHVLEVEAAWARLVRAAGRVRGACCISPLPPLISPSGMPPEKPWANRSTGSWAAAATVCRPMPAIAYGIACRSMSWRNQPVNTCCMAIAPSSSASARR